MTVQTIWDNDEKTILRLILDGNWTWEEIESGFIETRSMSGSVPYCVDLILDIRGGNKLPPESPLSHLRHLIQNVGKPENAGVMVIVGADTFARAIAETFTRVYSRLTAEYSIVFAETIEEAYQKIAATKAK